MASTVFRNALQFGVMPVYLSLDRLQPVSDILVSREHSPEMHECANHLNAGLNCLGALQQVRQHDCAVFGKHMRQILQMLAS